MPPLTKPVTNGYKSSALLAERSVWATAALETKQIAPDTFEVKLAENPAGRVYMVKIYPDGSATAFTLAPDDVLERAVVKGETRPTMAIGMASIVDPSELSIESEMPPGFTTSSDPKKPFFRALRMLTGTTAANDLLPWKMDAYASQEAAKKGAKPTSSVFYVGTAWAQGKPAQTVTEAEAVARVAANVVPVAGTLGNTVVSGEFWAD